MGLRFEHNIGRVGLPLDDFRADGIGPERAKWPSVDEGDVPVEHEVEPGAGVIETDPETDSLVAQYFGDVRQFALLTRSEEDALWQRIEYLKKRVRRALYTSPICLPTLQHLWQEVAQGNRSVLDVAAEKASNVDCESTLSARFEAIILSLQEQARYLRRLKTRKRRRAAWQARADGWRQWLATCEALPLQSCVYEEMHRAMCDALKAHPEHVALRAAYTGWSRAQRDLEDAKARMLRANLRLVIYMAKRYRNDDVPFLDLIQEGNIGLMRALEKFEPSRGLKFVTYAHWWVRQSIGRAIIEQHRTVRLPNHVVERKNKLRAAENKLWQVHKRAPTLQELSAELSWAPHEVEALQEVRHVMVRLHGPLSGRWSAARRGDGGRAKL